MEGLEHETRGPASIPLPQHFQHCILGRGEISLINGLALDAFQVFGSLIDEFEDFAKRGYWQLAVQADWM